MRTPEEIESLLDEVESLVKAYKEADDEYQTNQRRDNWNNKYGKRFAPYTDKIKLLNGDDFDLMEESRKEYETSYSDLTDDEYCNALEENIKKTLKRIWPEAEPEQIEEATQEIAENASPEGDEGLTETHIEAEDKDGDGEISEDEVESHTVSEDEPEEDKEEEESEEEESDPVEDFRKELEEEKAKMPKRGE